MDNPEEPRADDPLNYHDEAERQPAPVVLLAPRDPIGRVSPDWTIIDLVRETEQAWFGKPLSNPTCPVLEFHKSAWKEIK